MASRPQGSPFRLIALHRVRFVQPFLKPAMRIAARQAGFPAAEGRGLGMRRYFKLQGRHFDKTYEKFLPPSCCVRLRFRQVVNVASPKPRVSTKCCSRIRPSASPVCALSLKDLSGGG